MANPSRSSNAVVCKFAFRNTFPFRISTLFPGALCCVLLLGMLTERSKALARLFHAITGIVQKVLLFAIAVSSPGLIPCVTPFLCCVVVISASRKKTTMFPRLPEQVAVARSFLHSNLHSYQVVFYGVVVFCLIVVFFLPHFYNHNFSMVVCSLLCRQDATAQDGRGSARADERHA